MITELWALRDGLQLAQQLHVDHIIVELDVLSVISLLQLISSFLGYG